MSRKLIAILRGITPAEAQTVALTLIEAGIEWIEVPLNSPQALLSIQRMAKYSDKAHIGAGTVIDVAQVSQVKQAGGSFIVSPNCDEAVIQETKALRMASYPGVFSPSECFAALRWGADALKLFPAAVLQADGVKALRAVLPADTLLYAVGGVDASDFVKWRAAGIDGFGIGTALYRPGMPYSEIQTQARQLVLAYDVA